MFHFNDTYLREQKVTWYHELLENDKKCFELVNNLLIHFILWLKLNKNVEMSLNKYALFGVTAKGITPTI